MTKDVVGGDEAVSCLVHGVDRVATDFRLIFMNQPMHNGLGQARLLGEVNLTHLSRFEVFPEFHVREFLF